MLDNILRNLIDYIREELPSEGWYELPGDRARKSVPSLTIGLARFQSYRGRTEAALLQELNDYVEEAGLGVIHFEVHDDVGVVQIW